jgi:hypothetical protein
VVGVGAPGDVADCALSGVLAATFAVRGAAPFRDLAGPRSAPFSGSTNSFRVILIARSGCGGLELESCLDPCDLVIAAAASNRGCDWNWRCCWAARGFSVLGWLTRSPWRGAAVGTSAACCQGKCRLWKSAI